MQAPRIRVRRALLPLLVGAAFLPVPAALAQEPAGVRITDTLEPVQLEVVPGTAVTWRNEDDERHRVRSREGPEEFDSGNLEPGESFTFTFSAAGSYPYLDERDDDDSDYFGTIVVVPAATASGGVGTALPSTGAVSLIDDSFAPATIAIAAGGTVTWSNDDGDDRHTVTSDNGAFDSGILEGGATFIQTFDEPGTYPYACLIHPEMRGTVTVAAGVDTATPSMLPAAAPSAEATSGASPATPAAVGAEPVTMLGREFHPGTVEVAVGETVDWLNDDGEGHTVSALDGSFNSGILGVGDAFSHTFTEPGTFDYLCAIHPEMKGTVTVTE